MSFLLVKSIPLSWETREAWWKNDCTFLKRSRNGKVPLEIAERFEAILNLGNVNLDVDSHSSTPVFNSPTTIRSISTANALRETLNDFIPAHTITGPHWHKRNGFGGAGKRFCEDIGGSCAILAGDSQQHIDGIEYRVLTVGNVVVQAARKECDGRDDDGLFRWIWEWCGVSGVSNNAIIPLLKDAVTHIPKGDYSVFGWDIIHDGERPFIIECNTSPGVNEYSAERIVKQIRKVISE